MEEEVLAAWRGAGEVLLKLLGSGMGKRGGGGGARQWRNAMCVDDSGGEEKIR